MADPKGKDSSGYITLKGPLDLDLIRELNQEYTGAEAAADTGSDKQEVEAAWESAAEDAADG